MIVEDDPILPPVLFEVFPEKLPEVLTGLVVTFYTTVVFEEVLVPVLVTGARFLLKLELRPYTYEFPQACITLLRLKNSFLKGAIEPE